MKHLKNFNQLIEERLGVPEGIVESGKVVYDIMMKNINSIYKNIKNEEFELNEKTDLRISTMHITDITLNFLFTDINDYNTDKKIELTGMHYESDVIDVDMEDTFTIYNNPNSSHVTLGVLFIIDKNISFEEFKEYFIIKKNIMTSSFTHELKHSFDKTKNPKTKITGLVDYRTNNDVRFGIKEIDKFFHFLYFVSVIENVVRPSEIASFMDVDKVKKSEFNEFIKNNRTYKTLKEIQNFSYEGLKEDLLKNIVTIRKALLYNDITTPKNDIDCVEKLLELTYNNILEYKTETLSDYLTDKSSIMRFLRSKTDPKKLEYIEKYVKNISKYKNYDNFFKSQEKMFKFVSTKMIKKITKLFDMAEDTNKNKLMDKITNKTILNREAYLDQKGVIPRIKNI